MTMSQPASNDAASRAHVARAGAVRYLRGRQSPNGGFCFYRSQYVEEPNLSDTHHAVAALRLLGAEIPRRAALTKYLRNFAARDVYALYYKLFTLDRLASAPPGDPAELAQVRELAFTVPRSGIAHRGWLERTFRVLRLKRRFAAPPDWPPVAAYIEHPEAGRGGDYKPNLPDTFLCLGMRALLAAPPAHPETRAFVDALQVPVFGFTATIDSRAATLAVIHAGLECCALLGLRLRFRADILAFVLGCQAADGGFAPVPGALPDIEMSRRALQILRRLDHDA